jgi:hypothetical protein
LRRLADARCRNPERSRRTCEIGGAGRDRTDDLIVANDKFTLPSSQYFQSLTQLKPQKTAYFLEREWNVAEARCFASFERCARASSRALVQADWLLADCQAVTFAQRFTAQVRLPSSVAIPENETLTCKKKAPEQGAFAFSLMVESACSIPLQGVASWHSLPQKQNNGPVFSKVTAFKGARKVQSHAEIRATGRYLMRRYTPTSRSHEVQGHTCKH